MNRLWLKHCQDGVLDTYRGGRVKAFAALKPGHRATDAQITAPCKQQLSAYKAPRSVEFRSELPLLAAGKVRRQVLAEEEKARAVANAGA